MDVALKEWAVVVEALLAGRQAILLRRGGIVEARNGFQVRHREFLLFPTFEHQHASFIRAEHDDLFRSAMAAQGRALRVEAYAEVVDTLAAPADAGELLAAPSLHIWNERYIAQRYEYRPDLPLTLLIVRAYRLNAPAVLPLRSAYAGCKSWVNLTEDVNVNGAVPALDDAAFEQVRADVKAQLTLHAA